MTIETIMQGLKEKNELLFIAEIGQNHAGNMDIAEQLIKDCIRAGASFIKFQLYSSKDLFTGEEPFYKASMQAELTESQAYWLAKRTLELGGHPMFSIFDVSRLYWIADIWNKLMPNDNFIPIKIASRINSDIDMMASIKLAEKQGQIKPVVAFISLGMKPWDIITYKQMYPNAFLLECKADYPCAYTPADWEIYVQHWKEGITHGLSDHSIGTEIMEIAIKNGAKVIEKHITWDKEAPGPDHSLSITPIELAQLIQDSKQWLAPYVKTEENHKLEAFIKDDSKPDQSNGS